MKPTTFKAVAATVVATAIAGTLSFGTAQADGHSKGITDDLSLIHI